MRLCAECGVSEAVTACDTCGCGLCDDCKVTSKIGQNFCPTCAVEVEQNAIENVGISEFDTEIEGIESNAFDKARREVAFASMEEDESPSDNHWE